MSTRFGRVKVIGKGASRPLVIGASARNVHSFNGVNMSLKRFPAGDDAKVFQWADKQEDVEAFLQQDGYLIYTLNMGDSINEIKACIDFLKATRAEYTPIGKVLVELGNEPYGHSHYPMERATFVSKCEEIIPYLHANPITQDQEILLPVEASFQEAVWIGSTPKLQEWNNVIEEVQGYTGLSAHCYSTYSRDGEDYALGGIWCFERVLKELYDRSLKQVYITECGVYFEGFFKERQEHLRDSMLYAMVALAAHNPHVVGVCYWNLDEDVFKIQRETESLYSLQEIYPLELSTTSSVHRAEGNLPAGRVLDAIGFGSPEGEFIVNLSQRPLDTFEHGWYWSKGSWHEGESPLLPGEVLNLDNVEG